ncbi:MAG: biotin transporter BioY [Paracoccaceae bacterium]
MALAATRRDAPVALRLGPDTLPYRAALVLLGTLVIAAGAWVEVPMVPVPMTMQTFAVAMVGALYGWRLGGLTVLAYLAEGAAGLPVFSGGAGGFWHLAGPTAGYLFAFPVGAALAGLAVERGALRRLWSAFAAMLAAHAIIVVLGVAWLATAVGMGWQAAFAAGAAPFLIGMVVKSALATTALLGLDRAAARRG